MSNVTYLKPDDPATIQANRTSPERVAEILEQFAAKVRNGEETFEYGVIVYYNRNRACEQQFVGTQTVHDSVLLLTLAQADAVADAVEHTTNPARLEE